MAQVEAPLDHSRVPSHLPGITGNEDARFLTYVDSRGGKLYTISQVSPLHYTVGTVTFY